MNTHQDDEIRYIFTPIEQSYSRNLKNILFGTTSRKEKGAWANKARLVGMFEIEWKTPPHNIMVEFLNNWKLDSKHNRIKDMLGGGEGGQRIIDKHVLVEVFRIYRMREIEANQVEMFDVKITLAEIKIEYLTFTTPMKEEVQKR